MLKSDLESIQEPEHLDMIEFLVVALSFLAQFCPVFQFKKAFPYFLNGRWWVQVGHKERK